jgi:hypothetical protein
MIVWHYTLASYYASIEADGAIRPAVEGIEREIHPDDEARLRQLAALGMPGVSVPARVKRTEHAAVWFSKRSTWEPTATKGILVNGVRRAATIDEMIDRCGRLVRIGVVAAGMKTWVEHRKTSGISAQMATGLVRAAIECGSNPGDWLVVYGPVRRDRWVSVEFSTNGTDWKKDDE